MGYEKLLGIIAVIWIIVCVRVAFMGWKNKKKPNPRYEKIPIILGLSVAGGIGLLAIIGYFFFD